MDWLLTAALGALSIPLGRIATSTPMWRAAPKNPTVRPSICVVDIDIGRDTLRAQHDNLCPWPRAPFDSAVPGGILRHWPTPIMPSRLRAFERP